MKASVITIYKKRGETPLACIEQLRKERPELKDVPLCYAGRLDPMAEGVLLVLVGEENKKKEQYQKLPKEYICDVLFGFSTDSYDILGKLTNAVSTRLDSVDPRRKTEHMRASTKTVLDGVSSFRGKMEQLYPPYSSKTVDGKPLFEWAREGKIDQIIIPLHEIEIFDSALIGIRTITTEELWGQIDEDIGRIKGDFRQKEIRDCWWEHIRPLYGETFDIATISVHCSSGTYIRSIAQGLGEKIGIPTLALKIVRTKVGEYAADIKSA